MTETSRDFPAKLDVLHEALAFAQEAAVQAGLGPSAAGKLELALEEILVNVCSYAYDPGQDGQMTLRVTGTDSEVVVEVEDAGREFQAPSQAPVALGGASIEDIPIGGLGIFLAGAMVDELTYRREGGRNIVRLAVRTAQ